jgi:hypothetical protein
MRVCCRYRSMAASYVGVAAPYVGVAASYVGVASHTWALLRRHRAVVSS